MSRPVAGDAEGVERILPLAFQRQKAETIWAATMDEIAPPSGLHRLNTRTAGKLQARFELALSRFITKAALGRERQWPARKRRRQNPTTGWAILNEAQCSWGYFGDTLYGRAFRPSQRLTRARNIRSISWWSGIRFCPTPEWPTVLIRRAERVNRKAAAIRVSPRGSIPMLPPVSGKRLCAERSYSMKRLHQIERLPAPRRRDGGM